MTGPRLSAGVLTADLTRLGAELDCQRPRALGPRRRHGRPFCPQLTVGPAFLARGRLDRRARRRAPDGRRAARFLPEVVSAGAAIVTVHAEASRHPHRVLQELTALSASGPAGDPRLRAQSGHAGRVIEPVLDLIDLVLVLAVNPGWSGQAPAANTARRIAAAREITLAAGPHPRRRRRRRDAAQRRPGGRLGRRPRRQRQRDLRRQATPRQPGRHAHGAAASHASERSITARHPGGSP